MPAKSVLSSDDYSMYTTRLCAAAANFRQVKIAQDTVREQGVQWVSERVERAWESKKADALLLSLKEEDAAAATASDSRHRR